MKCISLALNKEQEWIFVTMVMSISFHRLFVTTSVDEQLLGSHRLNLHAVSSSVGEILNYENNV